MARLEELSAGGSVRGIAGDAIATIVNINWYGSNCVDVVYKTPDGRVANDILYRDDEARIQIVQPGRVWSFGGAGNFFLPPPGAPPIKLALFFAPPLPTHTPEVDPLPHQITAVYA